MESLGEINKMTSPGGGAKKASPEGAPNGGAMGAPKWRLQWGAKIAFPKREGRKNYVPREGVAMAHQGWR